MYLPYNTPMKIWGNIAACLFVLCFPLLLLSSNIRFEVSEIRLYEYGFDKYNITEVTGLQKSDLMKGARGLIDYFNGSEESPQVQVTEDGKEVDLFNLREVLHLRDVKSLIQLSCNIQWITLAYILVYMISGFIMMGREFLRKLMQVLVFGSVFTLGLLAFFGLWAATDFDSLFLTFHRISFSNDLWMLDSEDYLIMM
ncbi:MAG: TIGR01906 family membrane protein, partial [Dehalococcoidia bacterium]